MSSEIGTDTETRLTSENAVISSVPQYVETSLVSGILVPPTHPHDLPKVHSDVDDGVSGGSSSNSSAPSSKDYLLTMKQQDEFDNFAQKQHHVKEPLVKKDKFQNLKKPDKTSCPENVEHRPVIGIHQGLNSKGPDELDREMKVPEDRQKEHMFETTACDANLKLMQGTSTPDSEDHLHQFMKRSNTMAHRYCHRIFQIISFPFSLILVFIIELMAFITQNIIKVLILGFVTVLGDHVIASLMKVVFNQIIQPVLSSLISMSVSVRDILRPLLDITKEIALQIALPLKTCRLVEINNIERAQGKQDV